MNPKEVEQSLGEQLAQAGQLASDAIGDEDKLSVRPKR